MARKRRRYGSISENEQEDDDDQSPPSRHHEISVPDQADVFAASCCFQDLGLCDTLSNHMKERMGFAIPTHIQRAAIPSFLSNRDLLVNAETGTGKTLVYLAPIVHKLQANMKKVSRADGTYALVLVPTRELCLQVHGVAKQLVHRFQWLVPGYVMGGENRLKEKARLRKGVNILIATPGRLLDHLQNTGSFGCTYLRWIIFDEADRLLDLGFGKDIKNILSIIDSQHSFTTSGSQSKVKGWKRQHVLLSATLDEQVLELASLSLKDPLTVGLKEPSQDVTMSNAKVLPNMSASGLPAVPNPLEYALPAQLLQSYITVSCDLRLVTLMAVLHMWLGISAGHKVVVFLSTCDSVDFHYALLNEFSWSFYPRERPSETRGFLACKIQRLHGNMTQQERTETFLDFSKEASALLLCTDVAARGLDIPRVTHIIQYDPPGDANEYVHRVGRTARLGRKGKALLFLQPCEQDYLKELQKHNVMLKEFSVSLLWRKLFMNKGKQNEATRELMEEHPTVIAMQKALETFTSKQGSMKSLAADAFRSFVRAYTAHKGDLKSIFQVKKLHLGHVAKSFGLSDRPSLIGRSFNKKRSLRTKSGASKRSKKKRKLAPAEMLE